MLADKRTCQRAALLDLGCVSDPGAGAEETDQLAAAQAEVGIILQSSLNANNPPSRLLCLIAAATPVSNSTTANRELRFIRSGYWYRPAVRTGRIIYEVYGTERWIVFGVADVVLPSGKTPVHFSDKTGSLLRGAGVHAGQCNPVKSAPPST